MSLAKYAYKKMSRQKLKSKLTTPSTPKRYDRQSQSIQQIKDSFGNENELNPLVPGVH